MLGRDSTLDNPLTSPMRLGRFTINTVLLALHVVLFHFLGKCIDRSGHMRRWIAVGITAVGVVRAAEFCCDSVRML